VDTRKLSYFVAVSEQKNFTRAAEILRIAQPALGLQIRRLEEQLKVQLLVRHSRGVELTDAGVILLEHARDILERIDLARAAVRDSTSVQGERIIIGMAPSISAMLSYPLIKLGAQRFSNVSIVLVEELSSVLLEWLENGRIDIAIGYELLNSAKVAGDPLFVQDFFLVQSPEAKPRRKKINFAELADIELLMPASPHGLRQLMEARAARLGLKLRIRFEVQSISILKELVEQGVCATVLSYGAVARECEKGLLVATEIVNPTVKRIAYLAYSLRTPRSKAKAAMLAFIRELALKQKGVNSNIHGIAEAPGRAAKNSEVQTNRRRKDVTRPRTPLTRSEGPASRGRKA
jgi:LysR family transcriptional regulator, nitrogen assimilation regulatory protein